MKVRHNLRHLTFIPTSFFSKQVRNGNRDSTRKKACFSCLHCTSSICLLRLQAYSIVCYATYKETKRWNQRNSNQHFLLTSLDGAHSLCNLAFLEGTRFCAYMLLLLAVVLNAYCIRFFINTAYCV